MASSDEVEMLARSTLKSNLLKVNYMTMNYSCLKWDGTQFTSVGCANGYYTICKVSVE